MRRLRIFGQRDKLKADRSKGGVISGRKEEAAQRGVQSAGGDGGAFGGEDPGGAVGGVWGSSDDDQQLEAGAGETSDRAVCARQQGAGGRGCEEGDRRSASEDRPVTGRVRFSSRAARHLPIAARRAMIAPEAGLSVSRQCTLLGIARSSFYYRPRPESAEELELLERLDRIFTDHPIYGSRRLQVALLRDGVSAGRRHIRRLMRKLGLWAVRPKRNTSKRHPGHKVYPYLLRGKTIDRANQAWAADITYLPMRQGFLYLVAIIDWATRRVLSWRLSNTLTAGVCVEALDEGWPSSASPTSSIPTKARSSPATSSRRRCGITGSRSAWTGAGAATITSASSACGGP